MKLHEVLNNSPKVYVNVVPPKGIDKGYMIATIMRDVADGQGTMDSDWEGEARNDLSVPEPRYRRQYDDVGTSIAQKARKLRRKIRDSQPEELDVHSNTNHGVVDA
jgi:hypothetical protein